MQALPSQIRRGTTRRLLTTPLNRKTPTNPLPPFPQKISSGGTLVELSWKLTSGPPRTTPNPIWAETPNLAAVAEKKKKKKNLLKSERQGAQLEASAIHQQQQLWGPVGRPRFRPLGPLGPQKRRLGGWHKGLNKEAGVQKLGKGGWRGGGQQKVRPLLRVLDMLGFNTLCVSMGFKGPQKGNQEAWRNRSCFWELHKKGS